mmetsp:Transcript_28278/g.72720  ORF Transcript_28278/g.72720 Transcript_28278/m.72720 type:complete len:318 (+) Transcript_28278:562-1515(+)
MPTARSKATDLTEEMFRPHERSPGMRTYFGKQIQSDKTTSPAFGFGGGTRDAQSKLYASREQSKATPGNESQGPVYNMPDSVGKQSDSRKITPPSYGFGSSTRPSISGPKSKSAEPGPGAYKAPDSVASQHDSRKKNSESAVFGTGTRAGTEKQAVETKEQEVAMYGKESPPPNFYNLRGSIGKQNLSNKKNLPSTKIGTASRFAKDNFEDTPGAGTYKAPDSVGKQAQSRKKNSVMTSFGTATRDGAAKVFISHEHGKVSGSGNSPGPTTAETYVGTGRQTISTKKTAPASGFGTSKRPAITGKLNDSPGPGSYWI